MMTRRQAIKQVRRLADAVIKMRTREAIEGKIAASRCIIAVEWAFYLARKFR